MEQGRLLDLSDHMNRALSEQHRAVLQRDLPAQNGIKDTERSSDIELNGCRQYVSRREQYDRRHPTYNALACSSDCSCDCHTMSKAKDYSVFSFIFGSKFFGLRTFTRSCNDPKCSAFKRRISYTYIFPTWLLCLAITVIISKSRSSGPGFNLRVMNIVDRRNREELLYRWELSPSINIAWEFKRQLDTGEASIFDIDAFGNSSILVCLHLIMRTEFVF